MSAKAGPSKRGGDAENVEKQAKRVKAAEVRALGQITATALHLSTDSYVPQPPPQEVLRRVKKLAEEAKRSPAVLAKWGVAAFAPPLRHAGP